ncbi:hypothetical protein GCM10022225_15200 [Plantactinospora mayteni]|uniref:Uncharacterized protein n=1 Tax=Plantactinospora mayteni TaxID=566021 RepID=A0ABQ4EFU1_9ACTN|nr:hypothetical protein [Plantactinospora mayteni]GIG93595.1 hypothetical protein Pma05_01680 [Plantactinospora mayteni]
MAVALVLALVAGAVRVGPGAVPGGAARIRSPCPARRRASWRRVVSYAAQAYRPRRQTLRLYISCY